MAQEPAQEIFGPEKSAFWKRNCYGHFWHYFPDLLGIGVRSPWPQKRACRERHQSRQNLIRRCPVKVHCEPFRSRQNCIKRFVFLHFLMIDFLSCFCLIQYSYLRAFFILTPY